MSDILVSVIIACYNAEQFVGAAIRSALAQTYPHKEILVIDDGSIDGSRDAIKSFGDRIRWENGPHRGGSAARNRGVELADGELIQFLDADDWLHPQKLERQVPRAVRHADSIVYCDYDVRREAGSAPFRPRSPRYDGSDPVVFALRAGGLQTSAPVHWKRNLQAIGGFREELPCSQERDLHLRLACAGLSFHHLPETLYTVRRTAAGVSSDSVGVLDQHSNLAWNAYEMLGRCGQLTGERRAALAGFLAADARAYLRHGLIEKARDYFRQAAQLHPDGGLPQAYSGRTRWLYRLLGPVTTQRLVDWKRNLTATR